MVLGRAREREAELAGGGHGGLDLGQGDVEQRDLLFFVVYVFGDICMCMVCQAGAGVWDGMGSRSNICMVRGGMAGVGVGTG